MDMIPLRNFLPSSNSKDRRQKEVVTARSRQRGLVEASDEDEAAPTSLTVPKTQGKKARIASQPAPLSDGSDFDRDEEHEEDRKKRKLGRQSNKSDRKSRKDESLGKAGRRSKRSSRSHSSTSSVDELEVADDDSQTFAGFKMRVAAQEQVRVRDEWEENRSQKNKKPGPNIRGFIDIEGDDDDGDPDSAKVITSTSMMSQSVQISRRKRPNLPQTNMDESWPYHIGLYGPEEESGDEDAKILKAVNGKKTDLSDGGKKTVSPNLERRDSPTIVNIVLCPARNGHHLVAVPPQDRMMTRMPRITLRNQKQQGKAASPTPAAIPNQVNSNTQPSQMDEEDEILNSEDECNPLVFDANIGKLIRPTLPTAFNKSSNPHLEEGQSEEEEGYQATGADEKAPKKSELAYWKYTLARAQVIKRENDEAERNAKELGMRPDFTCTAEKQRKKPYRLDPLDKGMVVPISLSRFLRRYQRIGIQFFYDRYKGIKVEGIGLVKGGILGDDMGLGKTIQVLGFLSAIMGKTGTEVDLEPHRSRKGRWRREIETWTYLEYAAVESRADILSAIQKYKNGFLDVVLISFDQLVSNIASFQSTSFSVMIIDEAHTIKNPDATRSREMKTITAECRFAMTGTFIQNRFTEMWSVLDFVVPGLVGEYTDWKRKVAKTVDRGMDQNATVESIARRKKITDALHKIIMPLLFLRRTKAAVALELPKKNDHVVFCPLTQVQELVYGRIEAQPDLQAFIQRHKPCPNHPQRSLKDCCYKGKKETAVEIDKGIVFRYIDIFKKVSSHIGLVYSQAKDYIPQDLEVIAEELMPTNMDPYYRNLPSFKANILSEFSGKWVILNTLLRSWKDDVKGKHKDNCEMLHGGVKDEDRTAAVDRFQRPDSNVFVFLISTLAGGVGLNLTAANKVVIFDPNWNPAHDLQAMDRAFRMGQKRDVDVYRLISLGTIEENIYERQVRKSSAMRIIYDDAVESRLFEGHEARGVTGDLWGVINLFAYSPEGTSLQRAAKLASEEAQLADNLRDIISDKLTTLKIETSYEEENDQLLQGTEKGTEIASVSEDATLLDAVSECERVVTKTPTEVSAVEQFIVEQAVEDYRNNPAARDRPANEYYRDATVTKSIKGKRTSSKRKSDGVRDDKERKAPRLTVAKSERPAGLVSDDDD
ncbi:hypothetical protein QFC20_001328 [Naganishia adeliensis]|uniref:Uncharacterized protein n=1 Tax=Naganishia adeliensis TaxID=92952 RepID=A0ACC2WT62_9TREE|nr:hypothetical protein QFC20_001328 [Naganishia adeliensis]